MPLTDFQREVLRTIATNRSVESHVAGGLVLNAAASSPRTSDDIDLFHDAEEAVVAASDADVATLTGAGYSVRRQLWEPAFRRAWIERDGAGVKIEWARDSAWRFFPIEPDPELFWRLHPFDALTNKALAMGSRAETRDLVDLVHNRGTTPLCAIVWAACAKDAGFTPLLLLDQMRRNARVDLAALREMGATEAPADLKREWLALTSVAEAEVLRAADAGVELGAAFVTADGGIAWFDSPGAEMHRATLGGVVPRFVGP